jgi:hypothetical protein
MIGIQELQLMVAKVPAGQCCIAAISCNAPLCNSIAGDGGVMYPNWDTGQLVAAWLFHYGSHRQLRQKWILVMGRIGVPDDGKLFPRSGVRGSSSGGCPDVVLSRLIAERLKHGHITGPISGGKLVGDWR